MKNLIVESGHEVLSSRSSGFVDGSWTMLPFMYINPSLIKPHEGATEDCRFYAPDNIYASSVLLGTLDRIRKAVPGVSFVSQNTPNHTAELPVFVRVEGERFFKAALVYDRWNDNIAIASHHLDCQRISRRSRGTVTSISSTSQTTLIRSRSLKDYEVQVTRIVKKICKALPVTVADFEEACFKCQEGLIKSVQKTHKEVEQKVLSYIGTGPMWGSRWGSKSAAEAAFGDTLRVAAFEALESLVLGTPAPTMDEELTAVARKAFAAVANVREEMQIGKEGSPVSIIKLIGEDYFVITDPRTSQRQRVTQLPDCVVPQVATLMAVGSGAEVCGVGASSSSNIALEVNMVVIVPNGTQV
jgi:hypothetical protein